MATTAFDRSVSGSADGELATDASLQRRMASVIVTADRLGEQLRAVYLTCGLQRHQIVSIQRSLVRLDQAGLAPTANEFWAATAQPRAQTLTDRATGAIERELSALLLVGPSEGVTPEAAGLHPKAAQVAFAAASATLNAALPGREDIDGLGRWWQRRLRRAATLKALPTLAGTAAKNAELVVSRYEMELLARPPWSHGDRLLSAFELAQARINQAAETGIAVTVNDLFAPPRRISRIIA